MPGNVQYTYDPVGNRLTKIQNNATTAYDVACPEERRDRADRITSVGGVAYVSDANGNLTNRGPDTFTYDQANRLVQAVVGATTAAYTYDGDGKRATKSVNGASKSFLYDIKASVPKLLDDGERRYVWRPTLAYAIGSTNNDLVHDYRTN